MVQPLGASLRTYRHAAQPAIRKLSRASGLQRSRYRHQPGSHADGRRRV